MTNKPMLSVERDLIESSLECLERCQEQAFQSCECETCLECGKMPDECTGTECAKTCGCSTCEHCCNELAIKELRDLLDKPVDPNELSLGGRLARASTGLINVLDDETQAWTETEALKQALEDWSMGKPAARHQGEPVATDERSLYDAWRESNLGYVRPFNKYEWSAWQARARIAEQPAPVAPFGDDTVVCRRYQLEQSPDQNFYHYDLEPVYGSVPVTMSELITLAEANRVAVVMPELKCSSEYRDATYTQTCMAGEYNRALDDVARLTGVKP